MKEKCPSCKRELCYDLATDRARCHNQDCVSARLEWLREKAVELARQMRDCDEAHIAMRFEWRLFRDTTAKHLAREASAHLYVHTFWGRLRWLLTGRL